MNDVQPVLQPEGCNHNLPTWGVTRQFDFGQFVILYDERIVNGKREVTPIVLSDEGDIVVREEGTEDAVKKSALSATGGVPIHLLYETENAIELINSREPVEVPLQQLDRFMSEGQVKLGETLYRANLPFDARSRLAVGLPVTVLGRAQDAGDEGERRVLIRFQPVIENRQLNEEEVNALLATGMITINGEKKKTSLSPHNVNSLLANREIVVAIEEGKSGVSLVRLRPEQPSFRPAATQFRVKNLTEFLARPSVPASDFSTIPIELTPDAIQKLRLEGRASVTANGIEVDVMYDRSWPGMNDGKSGHPLYDNVIPADAGFPDFREMKPNPLDPPQPGGMPGIPGFPEIDGTKPWEWHPPFEGVPELLIPGVFEGNGTTPQNPPLQKPILPRTGLQLAILLPWRQSWKLEGFSRGSLISSIALAPGEETTISILSWERRAKALEQSAETEVEQQVDFSQTTRDTEDIFREMTNQHDFQAQLNGSLDASYTNGVASIRVGTNGNVSNADSLTNVFRTTQNHMREVSRRASTRVRSKRITKITETVERGTSQEVIRRIRNANQCRTLTLDFHEVLAHYRIETAFLSTLVRVVVLIPNPISMPEFNDLIVRKNETTLHNALLDSALADGFEACRLLTAFEHAKTELKELSADSKEVAELSKERVKPKNDEKPANPHEQPLLQALREVAQTGSALNNAQIRPALDAINRDAAVTEQMRTSGQRWLFMMLCRAKLPPAFVNGLLTLAGKSSPTVADSVAFIDSLPGLGSYHNLENINDLSDSEKEDAGLDVAIKSLPGYWFARWAWFTGRCREEKLYRADDGGLAAKVNRLKEILKDYSTKAAEGEGIAVGNQLAQSAQENQESTSYLDKLEMKYGIEVVASAKERRDALVGHLNDHFDYYRYVLFQALPPGEQLRQIMEGAQQLSVGMFEPHVVAMNGPQLAVPLTPLGETKLAKTLTTLQELLKKASEDAAEAEEGIVDNTVILPTPGISVESWLGQCSGCEEHVEQLREAELRRVIAEARLAELEADRRAARLESEPPLLDDPSRPETASVRVKIEGAAEE